MCLIFTADYGCAVLVPTRQNQIMDTHVYGGGVARSEPHVSRHKNGDFQCLSPQKNTPNYVLYRLYVINVCNNTADTDSVNMPFVNYFFVLMSDRPAEAFDV